MFQVRYVSLNFHKGGAQTHFTDTSDIHEACMRRTLNAVQLCVCVQ